MNIIKILMTVLLSASLPASLAYSEENWPSLSKQDLKAIETLIDRQTPVVLDKQNPAYQEWLETGFDLSSELADQVKTYKGYVYTLKYYVNGFQDEHFQLKFKAQLDKQARWPGFFVYYQQGYFYVSPYLLDKVNAKNLPKKGARLLRCDGWTPRTRMLMNVFRYQGNLHLEADWVANAPWLFINEGNPWARYPQSCVFTSKSKKYRMNLRWRLLPEQADPELAAYYYQPQFQVRPFDKASIWISVPSFNASKSGNLLELQSLVNTAQKWRNKKMIVIDVRGNHGGNSEWGTEILTKLYGEPYFLWAQNLHLDHAYDEWRVSRENLIYLKTVDLPYVENSLGKSNVAYKNLLGLTQLMEAALNTKMKTGLVAEINTRPEFTETRQPENPVKGKVIVVTDGRCGSSCLTFVEQALNMPGLVLIGAPTHANSYYNEIRFEKLPSGYAEFGFPMKVTRNRARQANQPYTPRYLFPGNINDTEALQEWILKQVPVL